MTERRTNLLRIAVCDDENNALEKVYTLVCKSLQNYGFDFNVDKYSGGKTLLMAFNNVPYDIVFLDIDMQGIDGFETAKVLKEEYNSCFVIFVTSHSELVYKCFDFHPFHFVRKNCEIPIEDSIKSVVEKLIYCLRQERQIEVTDINGRSLILTVKDILYFQSIKHYVNICYIKDNKAEIVQQRQTLSRIIEEYKNLDFIHAHRSYVVNLRYILYLDLNTNEIVLKNNVRVPISKQYKKSLNDEYVLYQRNTV